jgi:hypothetical protein
VAAVREVARGGRYVNPELGARLVAAEADAERRAEKDPLWAMSSPLGGGRHAAKPPSAQRNPGSRDGMEACSATPSAPPSTAVPVGPKKKECVAELVGFGCAQPETARAVGLDIAPGDDASVLPARFRGNELLPPGTSPCRVLRNRRHAASVQSGGTQPSRLFTGPMWCRQVVPASRPPSPATKRDSGAHVVMWCSWCQAPHGRRSAASPHEKLTKCRHLDRSRQWVARPAGPATERGTAPSSHPT